MTKRKDDGGMDLDDDRDTKPSDHTKPSDAGSHDTHSSHKSPAKKVEKTERELREEEAQARRDEAAERGRPE